MAWITASLDTGFWVGSTINLVTESSTSGVLWKWKSLLKTAGWFVAASWNGTSGAKGEDILTSSVTGIPNNAWFVIAQPNSSRSYHVARTTADGWRAKYTATGFDLTGSVTAQFPGPLVTGSSYFRRQNIGGGTTRIDGECCALGSAADSAPNYISAPLGTISGTGVVHIAATNTDPYMFYIVNYHSASTGVQPRLYPSGVFYLDCMESGSSVVGFDPYVTYFRIPAGGYFPMLGRALINGGVGGGTAGFASMTNLSASFAQNTYGEFAYSILGGNPGNAGTNGMGYQIPANINGTSYQISGVNLNVYNGKTELFPVVAATNARFSGNSNNPRESGYKGVSSLFKWKGTHTAVGLSQPYTLTGYTLSVASPTARDWLCVSDTVFPWFGIIPSGTTENNEAMDAMSSSVHFTTSSNWFSGSMLFAVDDSAYSTTTVLGSTGSVLYRGRVGANYVYNVGTPPAGAVDVIIVKIGS